jgi:hypothetical protein
MHFCFYFWSKPNVCTPAAQEEISCEMNDYFAKYKMVRLCK